MTAPRLKEKYTNEIVAKLEKDLALDNVNKVPRLEKIVVNMGVGAAAADHKLLDAAMGDLRIITGQQPCVTRAKKSIAGFHLREGQAIGCKVTLRGDRMWEFLDRLLATALPRVRDFRGISPTSFDGRGNYTMGVTEQLIFSEIDYDKIDRTRGMDITFVTTAPSRCSTRWASRSRTRNNPRCPTQGCPKATCAETCTRARPDDRTGWI